MSAAMTSSLRRMHGASIGRFVLPTWAVDWSRLWLVARMRSAYVEGSHLTLTSSCTSMCISNRIAYTAVGGVDRARRGDTAEGCIWRTCSASQRVY